MLVKYCIKSCLKVHLNYKIIPISITTKTHEHLVFLNNIIALCSGTKRNENICMECLKAVRNTSFNFSSFAGLSSGLLGKANRLN